MVVGFHVPSEPLFEQRSWAWIPVNGGYVTVCFTVMGFIIGVGR